MEEQRRPWDLLASKVDQTRFQLLHLGLMRDYMQNEFGGAVADSLPFAYDFERILDDFVLFEFIRRKRFPSSFTSFAH